MAEDVTLFTDDTVRCEGPIRPGPSLYEWAQHRRRRRPRRARDPPLRDGDPRHRPDDVPDPARPVGLSRLVPPPGDRVRCRPTSRSSSTPRRAIDVADRADGRQAIRLEAAAGGDTSTDDGTGRRRRRAVARPSGCRTRRGERGAHAVRHPPPPRPSAARAHGRTRSVGARARRRRDRARFRAGVHRSGRARDRRAWRAIRRSTVRTCDTSRAGASRSSTSVRDAVFRTDRRSTTGSIAPPAPLPRFLDDETIDRLADRGSLDFRRDVLPLVVKEVGWAYYHELFLAHPDRDQRVVGLVRRQRSPMPNRDELDRGGRRRPFPTQPTDSTSAGSTGRSHGVIFETAQQLHDHVRAHVVDDVARRTDPAVQRRPRRVQRAAVDLRSARSARLHWARSRHDLVSTTSAPGGSASSCTTRAAHRRSDCANWWRSPTPGSSASSARARR